MGSIDSFPLDLELYDICPLLGFVAAGEAVPQELDAYYEPWTHTLSQMPSLRASKRLGLVVDTMPVLRLDRLRSEAERRRAYLTLAMLVQAYVFEDGDIPRDTIPAALSEPFLKICAYWGLRPILSHVGYCLWNWRLRDGWSDDFGAGKVDVATAKRVLLQSLDNVEPYGTFTGTRDEKVFGMIPLLVEAEGGDLVRILLDALHAARVEGPDAVRAAILICTAKLTAMSSHLQTLHDQCDPQVFYDTIRPCISGGEGMERKGLPDGFVFQMADGKQVTSKCVGATAAQSSLFQFLDLVFGIKHDSTFLREMRHYMPEKHRVFLEVVEGLPNIGDYVRARPHDQELQAAFERCLVELRAWRTRHVGLVTRYVVIPARRRRAAEEGGGGGGVKGTGGSLPLPFLKKTRDETTYVRKLYR